MSLDVELPSAAWTVIRRSPGQRVDRIRQSGLSGEALEASPLVGRRRGGVQRRTTRCGGLAAVRAAAVLGVGRG